MADVITGGNDISLWALWPACSGKMLAVSKNIFAVSKVKP